MTEAQPYFQYQASDGSGRSDRAEGILPVPKFRGRAGMENELNDFLKVLGTLTTHCTSDLRFEFGIYNPSTDVDKFLANQFPDENYLYRLGFAWYDYESNVAVFREQEVVDNIVTR